MPSELASILFLLDDPDPVVQEAVQAYVGRYDGDMSAALAEENASLTAQERSILTQYTLPARRKQLLESWMMPTRFLHSQSQDWETFEFLLSLLSDYLHDGVSPRSNISDALDELADEVEHAGRASTSRDLAAYLFKSDCFMGNKLQYYAAQNSNIGWVLESRIGNPISLVIIYMLVSQRVGLPVYGCNYPGHFLAWVEDHQEPYLVDCYMKGRELNPKQLLRQNAQLSQAARHALHGPCDLSAIVQRVLNNIMSAFAKDAHYAKELPWIQQLVRSLAVSPGHSGSLS